MEYRLRPIEHNSLKGLIGERLARGFIRNRLAPKLISEEKWDHVLLSNNDYKRHTWTWNTKLFSFDNFRDDFIIHGFYANTKLLSKYADVIGTLIQNHCTPDGLLFKLRETGRTNKLKEKECSSIARLHVTLSDTCNGTFVFPVVEGDLEVVEIKCGRNAKLMGKQKETYNDLIAKGIPLRMIKVRIVSFDLNRFLVEEYRFDKFL